MGRHSYAIADFYKAEAAHAQQHSCPPNENGLRLPVNIFHTLLGDGECEAGQVWEAVMSATHYGTNTLIAILDHNKYQEMGQSAARWGWSRWRKSGNHLVECGRG